VLKVLLGLLVVGLFLLVVVGFGKLFLPLDEPKDPAAGLKRPS
jgi:hypothetical protein